MSSKKRPSRGYIRALLFAVLSVGIALLLFTNRQYILDQVTVWQYHPSTDIVSLTERSSMNESGRFYFYATQPSIEASASFNQKCDRKEQSTAILGCYNGRYIYIYNVTNEKLDGIKEVTAAHEMLHAAYDRLSSAERERINGLLETEYNTLKDNKKLAERMAFYARTEPGERDNELHSVIGTEVAQLSRELENHYKRYFTDRARVVALHDAYESVFTELQERGEALSRQLTDLGNQIEADSAAYNREVKQLNQDINSFNDKARSGGFSTLAEFQAARSQLVIRANQLDAKRLEINNMVNQYESLRQELMSISSQSEALNHSIDSSLAPTPSL